MIRETENIKNFFYATKFVPAGSETFCSFMKNLKLNENIFSDLALVLSEKIEPLKNDFDIFVSVPKYKKSNHEIDYAEKLADMLSLKLNVPYEKKIISKIKDTKKLKILTNKDRFLEISSAFKLNNDKYKRICIVDDVYASGATVQEIVKTFNNSNITDIYVAVLVLQSQ
ncbi:MAG: hypothetical protein PHR82_05210 [Endomicrobiaceae bacterium]|nr:hypothetical protein [Endomicrobiaceae bacterium]